MGYNDILQLLQNHTSIRDYTDEQISENELKAMIHAAQHASSSNFIQAYSIVQVTDQEKIKQLATLANNERQILSAPVVLLFCADFNRLQQACAKHDVVLDQHNLENFIVTTVDTALFAQNFVIAAESRGYGICYIGGARNNPAEISDLFDLPEYVIPLFAMTVGVPTKKNEVKPRLPLEAVVHVDGYNEEKYDDLLKEYDETYNNYIKARTNNKKDITWTESMADFWSKPRRAHLKDFIQSKGYLNEE